MADPRNWKSWQLFGKEDEEEPRRSPGRLLFGDIPSLSSVLHLSRNTIRPWQSISAPPRFLPLIGQHSSWSEPEAGCQAGGDASAAASVNPFLNLGNSAVSRQARQYSLQPNFLNLLPIRPRQTLSDYFLPGSIFSRRSLLLQDWYRLPSGPCGSFLLQRPAVPEPQPEPVIRSLPIVQIREHPIQNDLSESEDEAEEEEEAGFDPWAPKLHNFWDEIEADYDRNRICACMGYRPLECILDDIRESPREDGSSDEAGAEASGPRLE